MSHLQGKITDATNIYDFLMSQPHVIPRYSYQVFKDGKRYIKRLSTYVQGKSYEEIRISCNYVIIDIGIVFRFESS